MQFSQDFTDIVQDLLNIRHDMHFGNQVFISNNNKIFFPKTRYVYYDEKESGYRDIMRWLAIDQENTEYYLMLKLKKWLGGREELIRYKFSKKFDEDTW